MSLDAACSLLLAAEQALPLRLAWADALLADLSKLRIYSWKGSTLPANATFGPVWQLATWVGCNRALAWTLPVTVFWLPSISSGNVQRLNLLDNQKKSTGNGQAFRSRPLTRL